ncbi:hypothetical protein WT27_29115 [Burkholderia territorii]|uniref:Uncharacterized protein n=1 Tax=Burkholderia territorii TaxID=1503055 RepID=A0A125ACT8_9BURK|nr:hypothetical protein WT27_29115 [Burkholderia territorii]
MCRIVACGGAGVLNEIAAASAGNAREPERQCAGWRGPIVRARHRKASPPNGDERTSPCSGCHAAMVALVSRPA